jgi:hypothetical protein
MTNGGGTTLAVANFSFGNNSSGFGATKVMTFTSGAQSGTGRFCISSNGTVSGWLLSVSSILLE